VLVQPEIPPNTGNITAVRNTGCTLNLVKPIGFDISLKARAPRRLITTHWPTCASISKSTNVSPPLGSAAPVRGGDHGPHLYSDRAFRGRAMRLFLVRGTRARPLE